MDTPMDALILEVTRSGSYLELSDNEITELEKYYNSTFITLRVESHFESIWCKTRKRIRLKCIPCDMLVGELIEKIKSYYGVLFDSHSLDWDILTVDEVSLLFVDVNIPVSEISSNGQLIVRIVKTHTQLEVIKQIHRAVIYGNKISVPWISDDVLNRCSTIIFVETGPLKGCVIGLDDEDAYVSYLFGVAIDRDSPVAEPSDEMRQTFDEVRRANSRA